MSKIILKKDESMSIQQFTSDIIELTEELREMLIEIFDAYYYGKCGGFPKYIIDFLFDEWLYKNMNPKTNEILKLITSIYSKSDINQIEKELRDLFSEFGDKDDLLIEILANKRKGESVNDFILDVLYNLFEEKIDIFIDQTSIQFIGRYLMLFVGIDKGAWKPFTPTGPISNVFLHFYWIIRSEMYKIIPTIYSINELDWLYISDVDRQGLEPEGLKELEKYESYLDKYLGRMYKKLSQYEYGMIDSDIWKSVYQKILPKEEVNRLGFVHTPDEIVDVILDLVEYKEENMDLCSKKILDPACGSGTFLINALSRLLSHLNLNVDCHEIPKNIPEWKQEELRLDIIRENLYGIDINPFATFLTTINLVFMLMDSYSKVRAKNPDYSLNFNILTNDSLAQGVEVPPLTFFTNARRTEAVQSMKKFIQLLKQKFDLVIGNPPWGIVLKGKRGPLGDEEIRKGYKNNYCSATGKYDIYVLFMERGIELLDEGGLLGFITQVMYVSQDYGDGIKEVIKENGSIETFIDLQTLGSYLFPKWTNYPAITIFRKGGKQKEINVIEVTQK